MTATPDDIRTTAEAAYDRARNNADLSGDARRRAIAQAYLAATTALEKLRTDLETATNGRADALAKQLYGVPAPGDASVSLSYRDAQDRAAAKAEDESTAIALINRAMIAGDDLMVRALLDVGYSNQWAGVINAYVERNPTKEAIAQELWDLGMSSGKASAVLGGFFTYYAAKPPELQSLSDYKIQEVASGQPSTSQQFA
ncbi:hypothetical protein GCM10023063_38830 [Arthrobacter methylotrophus]|uniref:Uncharacterized protein n=1 Tax=Arthrobacter methylotrophus TaxID=121291 RepID=A0ABV5UTT9_9MICC